MSIWQNYAALWTGGRMCGALHQSDRTWTRKECEQSEQGADAGQSRHSTHGKQIGGIMRVEHYHVTYQRKALQAQQALLSHIVFPFRFLMCRQHTNSRARTQTRPYSPRAI